MKLIITLLSSGILLFIAILNLNWAIGGKIMEKLSIAFVDGEEVKYKNKIHIIAFLTLLAFIFIILASNGYIKFITEVYLFKYGAFGIAFTFLARAYGDRNKYGLLKKIKSTDDAKLDTYIITPICIIISFLILSLIFLF